MQSVSRTAFSGQSMAKLAQQGLAQIETSDTTADQKRLLRDMLDSVQRFYSKASSTAPGPPGGMFSMPYTVHEEEVTSGTRVPYNGYAHAFAGMGIQFLLFAALNLGIEMLLERQRGMWKRLRSAPISRHALLAARATSATIDPLRTCPRASSAPVTVSVRFASDCADAISAADTSLWSRSATAIFTRAGWLLLPMSFVNEPMKAPMKIGTANETMTARRSLKNNCRSLRTIARNAVRLISRASSFR